MGSWLALAVTAPRWFLIVLCAGSSLFAMSMGYIAGLNTPARTERWRHR